LTKRRVRAKNGGQALKRARRKYPGLTVTKVNWVKTASVVKGEKMYQVIAHKRKTKK